MTQEEIILCADASGISFFAMGMDRKEFLRRLDAFAKLVAAKATEEANARANASWELMCKKMVAFEREACAKIVEVEAMQYAEPVWAFEIVNDIRARGQV
jgi:hypothetical protein